ncbi:hypothetical protein NK718_13000 [Alsobacter sp. SYSU M60028]|uniref:Uncharacterized protein n=1 Tax=Alsobacter ponti TaxID=2962936 RepID=A0ABT1LD51_9HYPH|nr:hypothetical protein [Alsobacter ponti]MCP8939436.1 hypothetical protein [Alsobacter ponti]
MPVLKINGNLTTDEATAVQNSSTDIDTGVTAGVDNEVAWLSLLTTMSASLQTALGSTLRPPADP